MSPTPPKPPCPMSPGVPNTVLSPANFAANLPPTLAKSQVSSVRKNLKLHLLSVLRHPSSGDFQPQITTLLVDLGTQQAEIARSMPSPRDSRKRTRDEPDTTLKKMKIGESWAVGFVPFFVALPSLGGLSTTLWGIKCPSGSSQCPSGPSSPSWGLPSPLLVTLGVSGGTAHPQGLPRPPRSSQGTQGSPSALLGAL